mgnify:CR=1 FL=1|tara:strand:+ start:206 stop:661 length:456 start_codon:yes stop_codon:yes gene_type:complete
MSSLPFPILPEEEIEAPDFQPLEPGWYTAEVTGSKEKISQAGNKMEEVEFSLTNGRKVWTTFNLNHPDEGVVAIAQRHMSQLAHAAGLAELSDTDELVGAYVQVYLNIRPSKGEWPARNEVRAYRSAGDSAPTPPAVAAAKPNSAPWAKAS